MERAGFVFKGAAAGAQIRMMAAAWHGLWLLLLAGALGPWGAAAALPPAQPPPDVEFTFLLPAGRRECFYQSAPGNGTMEAEYQVGLGERGRGYAASVGGVAGGA